MGQPIPPLPLIPNSTNYSLKDWKIRMAIYEINKHADSLGEWLFWHADSLGEWLFWKYGKGPTIKVKWPVGWVLLHQNPDGSAVGTESADPNDHFRPWLEKNVGKQNRDWMWKIGPAAADNGSGTRGYDTLLIKFSRKKAKWSSIAVLLWG